MFIFSPFLFSKFVTLLWLGLRLVGLSEVTPNAYLPCSSSYNWEDEYLDTLAQITNDIADIQYSHIIYGGDFNVDF